jgi:hypothetical protein
MAVKFSRGSFNITIAYLYLRIQKSTGMWYLGSRTARGCHPHDGYICSSKNVKPMILENQEDWKRKIILVGEPKFVLEMETKLLQIVDARKHSMSYNKTNNDGSFGFFGNEIPIDVKRKISASLKGKKKPARTAEHTQKILATKKLHAKPAWNKGLIGAYRRSEETKQKIRNFRTGKTQSTETKQKIAYTERKTKNLLKSLKNEH